MSAAQAMKRIPRIKFPQRHPNPSSSGLQPQAVTKTGDGDLTFFSSSKAPATVGGRASLQPKRAPVSNEEIEAILFCSLYNCLFDVSLFVHLFFCDKCFSHAECLNQYIEHVIILEE
ncbi:hypothetical protein CRYUN_Cryun07bG0140700 [Craigia yunnanensis]